MNENEIRACLRAATDAKILTGWNGCQEFGQCTEFFYYGPSVPQGTYSLGDTIAFCMSLEITPLYRASEPDVAVWNA